MNEVKRRLQEVKQISGLPEAWGFFRTYRKYLTVDKIKGAFLVRLQYLREEETDYEISNAYGRLWDDVNDADLEVEIENEERRQEYKKKEKKKEHELPDYISFSFCFAKDTPKLLRSLEISAIRHVLKLTNYNVMLTAKVLGISYRGLSLKINRYGLYDSNKGS